MLPPTACGWVYRLSAVRAGCALRHPLPDCLQDGGRVGQGGLRLALGVGLSGDEVGQLSLREVFEAGVLVPRWAARHAGHPNPWVGINSHGFIAGTLQDAAETAFPVGMLPHTKVLRAIELLGTEVAPVVRRELAGAARETNASLGGRRTPARPAPPT